MRSDLVSGGLWSNAGLWLGDTGQGWSCRCPVPSVVGAWHWVPAMSFPGQEGGPRMRFCVSVSPRSSPGSRILLYSWPHLQTIFAPVELEPHSGDHEVPTPALAGTELERQLPGSGSSLKPPASANQLGEIQTARWLAFPAWQASVCTWGRRDGGAHIGKPQHQGGMRDLGAEAANIQSNPKCEATEGSGCL